MHPRSPHLGALIPTQTCQGKINRQPTRQHRLPLNHACSLSRHRSAQSSNHDSPGVYAHRAVNIKGQELARQTMGNSSVVIVIGNTFKVCSYMLRYGTSRQPPRAISQVPPCLIVRHLRADNSLTLWFNHTVRATYMIQTGAHACWDHVCTEVGMIGSPGATGAR